MGFPKCIVNFDELVDGITKNIDITDDLEKLLKDYFDKLLEILRQLLGFNYAQHSIGLHSYIPALQFDYELEHIFNEDVILTGITYSQTGWKVFDCWDLYVGDKLLFDGIFTKELGEHKVLNTFYAVSANSTIKIVHHNNSGNSKQLWFDIDYFKGIPDAPLPDLPPEPPTEVGHKFDYLLRIQWNKVHRFGAAWINESFDRILINNYSGVNTYENENGGVWVDECYGMDGELSDGTALYSILGQPEDIIYFAIQRCPYCDDCDYIKITLEKKNKEIVHCYEISLPDTLKIVKAKGNIIDQIGNTVTISQSYTPMFKFDFTTTPITITPLWNKS